MADQAAQSAHPLVQESGELVGVGPVGVCAYFVQLSNLRIDTKSKDLAKDVAAMATDGGVLIYGIAEDDSKRLTILAPIHLIGTAERVASSVRTSVSEPSEILIQPIPTVKDPSAGDLIVVVPPSPRAPHMVTVDKDFRYYGRGPAGNIPLTEGEVARLTNDDDGKATKTTS